MGSVLVLYGSTDGQTMRIAEAMAETLRAEEVSVEVVNARYANRGARPGPFDAVIVAASVHAGGLQRSVLRWISAHRVLLSAQPTALVVVCLGILENSPDTQRNLDRIARNATLRRGWVPGVIKFVAGAVPFSRYGLFKRLVMRRIMKKVGAGTDTARDYEYTDWTDLRHFTRGFAAGHGLIDEPVPVFHEREDV